MQYFSLSGGCVRLAAGDVMTMCPALPGQDGTDAVSTECPPGRHLTVLISLGSPQFPDWGRSRAHPANTETTLLAIIPHCISSARRYRQRFL